MAENIANKLIGLVVTLVILGAFYLLFFKPIIDTTNDAFDQFGGLSDVAEDVQSSFDDAGVDGFELESFSDTLSNRELQRLQDCVEAAGQDVARLKRCAGRFR